jgi:hypothetical protein
MLMYGGVESKSRRLGGVRTTAASEKVEKSSNTVSANCSILSLQSPRISSKECVDPSSVLQRIEVVLSTHVILQVGALIVGQHRGQATALFTGYSYHRHLLLLLYILFPSTSTRFPNTFSTLATTHRTTRLISTTTRTKMPQINV